MGLSSEAAVYMRILRFTRSALCVQPLSHIAFLWSALSAGILDSTQIAMQGLARPRTEDICAHI